MFESVFLWLIGGLFIGLVLVLAAAYPDLKRDWEAHKKAFGRYQ